MGAEKECNSGDDEIAQIAKTAYLCAQFLPEKEGSLRFFLRLFKKRSISLLG